MHPLFDYGLFSIFHRAPEVELVVEEGEEAQEPTFDEKQVVLDACKLYIYIVHLQLWTLEGDHPFYPFYPLAEQC